MSSASDDSSDEEYKPQGEESDILSEAETDYDSDGNKVDNSKIENKKNKRRKVQIGGVEKRINSSKVTDKSSENEKDELEEEDEEQKLKSNALWASFLSDTNQSSSNKTEKENQKQETSKETSIKDPLSKTEEKNTEKYVTKIFDFAGEEVKVTEKVKESNPVQDSTSSKVKMPVKTKFGLGPQRSSGSGLAGALSQLDKKGKISTLEKTKLDWMNYKKKEGIEEEIQTHNKGKDG